jgi:hypothetical protein
LGHDAVERQAAYRELFRAAITGNELREIRECTHKGWALGSVSEKVDAQWQLFSLVQRCPFKFPAEAGCQPVSKRI